MLKNTNDVSDFKQKRHPDKGCLMNKNICNFTIMCWDANCQSVFQAT